MLLAFYDLLFLKSNAIEKLPEKKSLQNTYRSIHVYVNVSHNYDNRATTKIYYLIYFSMLNDALNAWFEQTFLNFKNFRLFFKFISRAKKIVWLQSQQSLTRAAFELTLYLLPAFIAFYCRGTQPFYC